jgi:transposase-like protein
MIAYSLPVHADVAKRMSAPNQQNVPQISKEGVHRSTLYQWRSKWGLQREVVPASEKEPEI